jgi:hypothetical protein
MTAAMQNALSYAVAHGKISIDDPGWDGLRVRALWRRGLLRPTRFFRGPQVDKDGFLVGWYRPPGVWVGVGKGVAQEFEPTPAGYVTMLLLEAPMAAGGDHG